jgi:hypothetical protein
MVPIPGHPQSVVPFIRLLLWISVQSRTPAISFYFPEGQRAQRKIAHVPNRIEVNEFMMDNKRAITT